MAIRRQYQVGYSRPDFSRGTCPACYWLVPLDPWAPFSDNQIVSCNHCGANTPRRALVLEGLARIDGLVWGLFGSDMYIWDQVEVPLADFVSYDLHDVKVAKWQHQEVYPSASSGERYVADVYFSDPMAFLFVTDTQAPEQPEEQPPAGVQALWYRLGLQEPGAVPAWRQSLFGAATLLPTHPAAAVVLVAAGFESFFIESMRIAWRENRLDETAFDRLNRRNLSVTYLVEWLPPAVNRRSLLDAPGNLYERWRTLVNERRNDVVHRANVHLTTDQAMQSMRAALECITFIDEAALVRPHAYYTPRPGTQAVGSDED